MPARVTGAELRLFAMLGDLTDDEADWIAARCDVVSLAAGDLLFRAGEPAEWMYLTVEGALEARRDDHGAGSPAFAWRAGDVAGVIPFSRMATAPSTGRALTPSRVARFPKAEFGALLARMPRLEPRFVAHLADRVREATRRDQQQEKLAALGRLAAGLAHELNNPAAAARRFAAELARELDAQEAAMAALTASGAPAAGVAALRAARTALRGRAPAEAEDALARSEREDALADWLAATGAAEPWLAAGTLADAGATVDGLAAATGALAPGARAAASAWLAAAVASDRLLAGIGDAAGRITELVASVKTYTHMDRAPSDEDVDLRSGLESTLALFAHRLRQRGVEVERDYAARLPRVSGRPGELNQLWTNLIDNASEAAARRITVRTAAAEGAVTVEIGDDGPGVPPALRDRIWEPFFTTKPVGQGTGLGLDIARRLVEQHGGALTLRSEPGDTRFCVRLPRADAASDGAERAQPPAPDREHRTSTESREGS